MYRTRGLLSSTVVLLFVLPSIQRASAQFALEELKSSKPGIYAAESTYPQFRDATALTQLANSAVASWVKKDQAEFIAYAIDGEAEKLQEELAGIVKVSVWEHHVGCRATILRPKTLISVICRVYSYSGGAHPNTWYEAFNFGTIAGQARPLTLSDFFRIGNELCLENC